MREYPHANKPNWKIDFYSHPRHRATHKHTTVLPIHSHMQWHKNQAKVHVLSFVIEISNTTAELCCAVLCACSLTHTFIITCNYSLKMHTHTHAFAFAFAFIHAVAFVHILHNNYKIVVDNLFNKVCVNNSFSCNHPISNCSFGKR